MDNEQDILKNYQSLPPDLREAIFSFENARAIEEIGKKYELYIDKIGELGNESSRVMLGLTHPKDFIANLSKRLGVDMEKAKEIAKDVNEQIFVKVRESLKKLHKIGEEEEDLKSLSDRQAGQISNLKTTTQNLKPEIQEAKQAKPMVEIPIKTEPQIPEPIPEIKPPMVEPAMVEQKPIEEKEILPEGIQRSPKQFREIKEEVEEAKKEKKYPGEIDPYRETIE